MHAQRDNLRILVGERGSDHLSRLYNGGRGAQAVRDLLVGFLQRFRADNPAAPDATSDIAQCDMYQAERFLG